MSPRLPSFTPKRVMKLLADHGFVLDHTTGSHYIYYHPSTHQHVCVPYHSRDLPRGTLISILRQANIDLNELR